jgi:sodium transport system ATP-binding protein
MDPVLEVQGLVKTFHLSKKQQKLQNIPETHIKALAGVDFKVYPGQIYGLLGPNGAGKTTALRIIATLIKPDSGDAKVFGHSVKTEPEFVRGKIGFLTSELKLEDFFSPSYLFDFFASLHQVPPEVAKKRKETLFNRFGINDFAEVKVANLSTGMRQKASLAISLVHDPDFIIFDEPTNGLDVLTAKVVTDFLIDLKNKGKTIIVSTHIFSLVEKICTHVGIIIKGRLVREGPLQEICAEQSLEDVFFKIYEEEGGAL